MANGEDGCEGESAMRLDERVTRNDASRAKRGWRAAAWFGLGCLACAPAAVAAYAYGSYLTFNGTNQQYEAAINAMLVKGGEAGYLQCVDELLGPAYRR